MEKSKLAQMATSSWRKSDASHQKEAQTWSIARADSVKIDEVKRL
jgi:hypothetical protein